jgi:putative CRISPR-associated protein (TIGR02620 family)
MNLIITRHAGTVAWLRRRGIEGTFYEQATGEEGHPGDSVYGVLPLDYVDKFLRRGLSVFYVGLPAIRIEQRKGDLSEAEMEEAGACLYRVLSVAIEPVPTTIRPTSG